MFELKSVAIFHHQWISLKHQFDLDHAIVFLMVFDILKNSVYMTFCKFFRLSLITIPKVGGYGKEIQYKSMLMTMKN